MGLFLPPIAAGVTSAKWGAFDMGVSRPCLCLLREAFAGLSLLSVYSNTRASLFFHPLVLTKTPRASRWRHSAYSMLILI